MTPASRAATKSEEQQSHNETLPRETARGVLGARDAQRSSGCLRWFVPLTLTRLANRTRRLFAAYRPG